jgi:hypothetical protein
MPRRLLCLAFLVALQAVAEGVSSPKPDVSIRLSLERSTVKAGAEIRVDVVETNTSHHVVTMGRTPPGFGDGRAFGMTLVVRDEQGKLVPEKEPDQSSCLGKPGCKVVNIRAGSMYSKELQPGKSLHDTFVLSETYDLRPGKYTVETFGGSNTITLTVIP